MDQSPVKEIVVVVVFFALYALFRYWGKLKERADWVKGKTGIEFSDPRILIVLGLVIFNLIVRAMLPWFWSVLYYKWYTLIVFNFGLGWVLYLLTVKTKTEDKKETKDPDPTAIRMAKAISYVLLAGLVTVAYMVWMGGSPEKQALVEKVGKDHPLVAIAGCVSNFRQFEPNGQPYIGPEGGVGLFQIPPSEAKFAKEKLGLDVEKKLEDNIKYAMKEFSEPGVALWWLGVASDVECWSNKLKEFTVRFEIPEGEPVERLPMLPECCRSTIIAPDGIILQSDAGETVIHSSTSKQSFGKTARWLTMISPEGKGNAWVTIKFFNRRK